ncbi:MocR-like pyridoxine biosynthesis transcription factor PdxR [Pseudodonghicola flavimaris]|uniref:PLP-dependent aminotransferase family protein n=1 Tax=Pseudodonghicola flavimaris TaxID=3050036 RepID=A0ABT7F2R3_9RHOB|nr:PLP-dependent aminotransferase family protein [Pseudodonghicola flavimaris]MDK3018883.1 PLP-dependent aminotransferase family protein [Pseudodonghicola flavimaris]
MANIPQNDRSNFGAALFGLSLERGSAQPMHAQLTEALRALLTRMQGLAGLRLPASRALAEELSVSRMTVTTAYDQLIAEGYLTTRQGSGTYVADHLPHLARPAPAPARRRPPPAEPAPGGDWLPFQPGLADPALFPHRLWARHLDRAWRAPQAALLGRPDLFGWPPLRAAISAHLAAWRGLDCDPAQVIVTGGAWEAFDILGGALLPPGAALAVEDPGWATLRQAMTRAGIRPQPLRIDADGLNPGALPAGLAGAVITPSRHFPTGRAMPLARRLALLDWAERHEALIIEDDYDSEFRYQGQPLPALSGLDGLRRTLYMGSFSKLLSPALRIGYLVVPAPLIAAAHDHLAVTGARASLVPQPALASFMESGDFATHLRRMRRIYARRQAHLLRALAPVQDLLTLGPDASGMHLCLPLAGALADRSDDRAIAAAAAPAGLSPRALSSHSVLPDPPQGLLLGYAGFDEATLTQAAADFSPLLRRLATG